MSAARCRLFSHFSPPNDKKSQYIKPAAGPRKYIGSKLLHLYGRYEEFLKRFPSLYHAYRVFTEGTRDLYKDFKQLTTLSIDLKRGRSVADFKFKELVIFYETPKDLIRVSPTILISLLPFANYVIFPLAYRFPRYMLSQHYWTLEQRVTFQVDQHEKKVQYYTSVFRDLQSRQSVVPDDEDRHKCQQIFEQLGSGVHPSVEQVLGIKSCFSSPHCYSLPRLSSHHQADLLRMHGLYSAFPPRGRTTRLMKHAEFLWHMDRAIMREGGPESLSPDDLRKVCFHRGLNPLNQHQQELHRWLHQWLLISSSCDGATFSLLLHSPVLLSFNHPSNRRLIH